MTDKAVDISYKPQHRVTGSGLCIWLSWVWLEMTCLSGLVPGFLGLIRRSFCINCVQVQYLCVWSLLMVYLASWLDWSSSAGAPKRPLYLCWCAMCSHSETEAGSCSSRIADRFVIASRSGSRVAQARGSNPSTSSYLRSVGDAVAGAQCGAAAGSQKI